MRLVRGETRRIDFVIRRGSEFLADVDVVDVPATTRCYEPADLNASLIEAQIRTGSDVDGTLVATFVVMPVDLVNGQFSIGLTRDETDAFEESLSIGTAYIYVDSLVIGSGNVRVKNPDDP